MLKVLVCVSCQRDTILSNSMVLIFQFWSPLEVHASQISRIYINNLENVHSISIPILHNKPNQRNILIF